MPKKTTIPKEKRVMLSDAELVAKYEAGAQPVSETIGVLLSRPNPNAHAKVVIRP